MFATRFNLYLGILYCVPVVISQTNITAIVGQNASLPCFVTGTYTLPGWSRNAVSISIQDSPTIHPSYAARYRIDPNDQKSLRITDVQESDEGLYECSYSPYPVSFTGLIVNPPTPTPENNSCETSCCGVSIAACVFFVLVMLVLTVVIIKCSHILIKEHKRQKEKNKNGKSKDNDGQNGCIGTEEDRIREHKLVWVIIITATVIFIAVSVWFIVMQATDEDCEEICECKVHIGLLAFEVVDFVLGVGFVIYLFYSNRDYPTCDQCGGGKKPPPSGPSAAVKHTAEINPDPLVKPKSGDTGPHYPDVSPQHRPQPPLPPKERHGSDLSSVSRRDVKLDPIPPIRKNISTTEFHMDNPESERCNIKVSSRGLSAVFDQEFDQPRTNRLAPLDHTVRVESIKRKKKKKTRTNNDNVKFDNDYD